MVFDDPSLISRLPDGSDSVEFEILNKGFFMAEDSNLKLDTVKVNQIESSVPQQLS